MRCLIQLSTFSFSLSRRRPQNSKTALPSSPYSSLSHELSLTSHLLSILHTRSHQSLFHSLDLAVRSPHLTPHVVSSVLSHPIPFPSSFYFYAWASSFKHLNSWRSHNLIVSILQSNIKNIDSFSLFDHIKANLNRPISSFAFVVVFRAYSESDLVEDALELFSRMPEYNSNPGTVVYNIVLDVLVKKGAIFLAMGIYNKMLKADCSPNKATFSILIQGFCKAGLFDNALELLGEMQSKGLKPDKIVYSSILSAYCRMKAIAEAEVVFDFMKKAGYKIDSTMCQAMLSGYCKSGRMDVAFSKLKEFDQEFGFTLKVEGYCSFIDGLFKAKKFNQACRVYEDMLMKNVKPNCIMYTVMIRGFLEVGRVKEAFKFLKEMSEVGIAPNTYCYNTLMKGLCDVGYVEKARFLMMSMSENGLFPTLITYNIMIAGFCRQGLVHDAWQIFHEMSEFGAIPDIYSYNSLIDGLYKAEMFEEARSLYDQKMNMKPFPMLSQGMMDQDANTGHYTCALRKKIEELCEMGHVVEAYKLFRCVMEEVVPDVVTFSIRVNRLFEGGKPNKAMQLFKELTLIGINPDEYTYSAVINGLLNYGRISEAFGVCQSMSKDMIIYDVPLCNTVMKLYGRAKRVMHAIEFWLNRISVTAGTGELDKINVIKTYFDRGHIETVVAKLIERDIEHDSKTSSPYTIWLDGFCRGREIDEAIMIFNALVKFDIEVTAPSCVTLINSLCSTCELGCAHDVMLYTLRRGFSLSRYVGNRLLRKLCSANRKPEAQELAWRMSVVGYDMDTYLRLPTKSLLYD